MMVVVYGVWTATMIDRTDEAIASQFDIRSWNSHCEDYLLMMKIKDPSKNPCKSKGIVTDCYGFCCYKRIFCDLMTIL